MYQFSHLGRKLLLAPKSSEQINFKLQLYLRQFAIIILSYRRIIQASSNLIVRCQTQIYVAFSQKVGTKILARSCRYILVTSGPFAAKWAEIVHLRYDRVRLPILFQSMCFQLLCSKHFHSPHSTVSIITLYASFVSLMFLGLTRMTIVFQLPLRLILRRFVGKINCYVIGSTYNINFQLAVVFR